MYDDAAPRVRRSLADIQKDYDAGNKQELETLMRAWKGIKELAPDDPNSFFMLGGFGVFAVYLPELFPTAVRATGQGFCFNFARVITGVGTVTTGYLVGSLGSFPMAGLIVSLVFGIGLFTIWIGPETRTWGLRDY